MQAAAGDALAVQAMFSIRGVHPRQVQMWRGLRQTRLRPRDMSFPSVLNSDGVDPPDSGHGVRRVDASFLVKLKSDAERCPLLEAHVGQLVAC